jgi:hypothetical protein
MRHACADSTEECSSPLHWRRWQGRAQQIGLVAQLAAQLRVALTPQLEAPRDSVEQPGFVQAPLVKGRPSEETRAQLGIPADVVPSTHLVLEKSRQEQALCARRFHHQTVVQQGRVGHKWSKTALRFAGAGKSMSGCVDTWA